MILIFEGSIFDEIIPYNISIIDIIKYVGSDRIIEISTRIISEEKPIYINNCEYFVYLDTFVLRTDFRNYKYIYSYHRKLIYSLQDIDSNKRVYELAISFALNGNVKSILDFGIGKGYSGKLIRNKFSDVNLVGVEYDLPAILMIDNDCRSYYNQIIASSVSKEIRLGPYDVCFLIYVVHLLDKDTIDSIIRSLSKENGLLVFNKYKIDVFNETYDYLSEKYTVRSINISGTEIGLLSSQ
jgi:hypothetical protein